MEYSAGPAMSAADNGTIAYLSAAALRARMVFFDEHALLIPDPDHSEREDASFFSA